MIIFVDFKQTLADYISQNQPSDDENDGDVDYNAGQACQRSGPEVSS